MPDLIITGFERALIFFRDSNGIATGVQSTLSNGSTSNAYVASLVRTASYAPIAPVNLDIQGGDKIFTTIQFGNAKIAPFDLILSNYDTTLVSLLSGTTPNTTNSQVTLVSDNPNKTSPRVLALGLQQRAVDTSGTQYYVTRFMPACQMRIKRSGPGFQGQTDTVISVTPQMVNKTIEGRSFGSSGVNFGLEDDKSDNYDYISSNPIHVCSFRQDNSTTTFITTYRPISSTITLNATPNYFFVGGVATALSSLSTTTGTGTLAAAGTAAVGDVLIYETNYVLV